MQRTVNYDLCQYEGSDKTSYLINYNGDMLKIDTAIKGAKDAADNAQSKANTADGKADANAASISTLDTQINGAGGVAADVSSLQGSVNTINSLIGTGEPTTQDKTIIGAINELAGEIPSGDVDAADVAYDNTQSGLTADDVQEAIDEVVTSVSGLTTNQGNLANLATTEKSSLVGAINELAQGGGATEYQDVDMTISNVNGLTTVSSLDITTEITTNAPSGYEPYYALRVASQGQSTVANVSYANDSKWYVSFICAGAGTISLSIKMRYKKSA